MGIYLSIFSEMTHGNILKALRNSRYKFNIIAIGNNDINVTMSHYKQHVSQQKLGIIEDENVR